MTGVIEWVGRHQVWLQALGAASVALFVLSLIVFPLVVIHLPADYFVRSRRDPARPMRRRPVLWAVLIVVKNMFGLGLILAGIAMLVLPGQGLLTILMGLALTNFPGKYGLERRMVRMPRVARALNRIRRSAGKPELELPPESGAQVDFRP
jgi:hypothetical protein